MRSIVKMLGFLTILSLFSCSSNKKANEADALAGGNTENNAFNVNGDSDSGTAGALNTVYFDFDSSAIRSDSKAVLDNNASFLKANKTAAIQIEGHCDERGGVQYNLALSEKRAKAVKDYLKAVGVSEKRMTTIGFGKEKPVDLGHDEAAWSKNRRANFVVTKK